MAKNRIFGLMEEATKNVKAKWDKSQKESANRKRIYNEAYKTAEAKAIKEKANRDASNKYAPQKVQPVDQKKLERMNPFGRF